MTVSACCHPVLSASSPSVSCIAQFLYDESGQDMIEYALVAATIGLGTVAGVNGLASHIANYLGVVDAGFDNSLAGSV